MDTWLQNISNQLLPGTCKQSLLANILPEPLLTYFSGATKHIFGSFHTIGCHFLCLSNASVQCHIHNFISFIPNKTIC